MPAVSYQPPDGYLTMRQAQELLGVSKTTLEAIVKRYGLTKHRDVRDSRIRLLLTSDIDRISGPTPVTD